MIHETLTMKAMQVATKIFSRKQGFWGGISARKLSYNDQRQIMSAVQKSVNKATDVWNQAGNNLSWTRKWSRATDSSDPSLPKWFLGGQLNTCYNCVDRHVEQGRGDQVAVLFESSVTNSQQQIIFSELYDTVSRLAAALVDNGLRSGDRVLIYMPAIPQSIFAMLACARIGATYIPVSGALSADALAARINHSRPRMVISANGGVEEWRLIDYKSAIDGAIALAEHKPSRHFVYQRNGFTRSPLKRISEIDFDDAIRSTRRRHQPAALDANHPLYIEYATDSLGLLSGVVRPQGGHTAALSWSLEHIFCVQSRAKETWFVANEADWATSHAYIALAPLLNAVTTVLLEGDVGSTNCFRLVDKYNCNVVLTSPTTVRAICADDPVSKHANHYEMDHLRHVLLASDDVPNEHWRAWAEKVYRKPAFNVSWRLEAQRPLGKELDAIEGSSASPSIELSNALNMVSADRRVQRAA